MTTMFGKTWATSQRKYDVIAERNVRVPMSDGVHLGADIFRPDSKERFPAILGYHPYEPVSQWAPIMPRAFASVSISHASQEQGNGPLEAGDPNFFVRRGYVHVIANVRGTGNSEGVYPFLAEPEPHDGYDLIEWIARQPWCDGNVGMFGVSYFARVQHFVASTNPPHLKCLFAPWGSTDHYRDAMCQGGILAKNWAISWGRTIAIREYESECLREWGEEKFRETLNQVLQDPDLRAVPELVALANNPTSGLNGLLADIVLNPCYGPFWQKRAANYDAINVPAYVGGDWGIYGLHLPGAFRSWQNLKGPKKMIVGPPLYLERPVYQLQYESLRWFDYWLKGIDTGIMNEPPVRYFLMGTHQWRSSNEWPLPETKWTPFFLHQNNLLWEREHFPNEACSSFSDSPWGRESLEFSTAPLVEDTEVVGPAVLHLYASSSDEEVLWFISLREVKPDGSERVLTRGWLRGSQRKEDPSRSLPWQPFHAHTEREPLEPGQIYEFNIPLIPTGNLFRAGCRIKLKIACTDDEPTNSLEAIAGGHLRRQAPSRVTIFHNQDQPSHLLLPITSGNVIGTYISGGEPYYRWE